MAAATAQRDTACEASAAHTATIAHPPASLPSCWACTASMTSRRQTWWAWSACCTHTSACGVSREPPLLFYILPTSYLISASFSYTLAHHITRFVCYACSAGATDPCSPTACMTTACCDCMERRHSGGKPGGALDWLAAVFINRQRQSTVLPSADLQPIHQ